MNEGDAYFKINESYEPHFDMAINVIIDLSAILLECIKNGKIDIKELEDRKSTLLLRVQLFLNLLRVMVVK